MQKKFLLVLAAMAIVILASFGIAHRYLIPQPPALVTSDTIPLKS